MISLGKQQSLLLLMVMVCGKSIGSIRDTLPHTTILDGLAIQEHELPDASLEVSEWLQELGFVK